MSEIEAILRYWILFECITLCFWPVSSRAFSAFRDRGLAFAKIGGFFFLGYASWLLSSLHWVSFHSDSMPIVVASLAVLVFAAGCVFDRSAVKELLAFARRNFRMLLLSEAVFFVSVAAWAYIRGYAPSIASLEKFMDYGFMLSALRTDYVPPLDPWFAGETINYYYLGHWIAALAKRLTGVESSVAYNLQMIFLFALSAQGAFSVGSSLVRKMSAKAAVASGLLTAFLLLIVGNLHTAIYWPLKGAEYWYPNATRYIHNTIHEFPIYSFVVNDLHGHVSNIPNVLTTLALLIAIHFSGLNAFRFSWLALSIGISFGTNAWDFAFDLFLAGVFFWATYAGFSWEGIARFETLKKLLGVCLALLTVSIFCFLPFWNSLNPPPKGIEWVGLEGMSPFWQLLIVWGVHLPLIGFVLYRMRVRGGDESLNRDSRFLKVFVFVGLLLVVMPELIYIKDIYPLHPRANTMFKFFYHAWILFAVFLGASLIQTLQAFEWPRGLTARRIAIASVSLLLLAGSVCTVRTVSQGFIRYFSEAREGLDGVAPLAARLPDDWFAVREVNRAIDDGRIPRDSVLLEATGESYTDYSRFSAYTGLQTVIGWSMHEWLWRGSWGDEIRPRTKVASRSKDFDTIANRVKDVQQMYEAQNLVDLKSKLDLYGVSWVIVGTPERHKYPKLNEALIREAMPKVWFERGSIKIYARE